MIWMCVFIWLRGTLPRLRQDQLMNFAWKFVLPMCLLNLFVAATVAIYGRGLAAVGGLFGAAGAGLRGDGARGDAEKAFWAEDVSVCGVSRVRAFPPMTR